MFSSTTEVLLNFLEILFPPDPQPPMFFMTHVLLNLLETLVPPDS